jgi:hypothetical protein
VQGKRSLGFGKVYIKPDERGWAVYVKRETEDAKTKISRSATSNPVLWFHPRKWIEKNEDAR